MNRGSEYYGCGEEYITWKKRKRGSNIIFPIILRLLGRISRGKGTEILSKKIKILEIRVGKNIKL